MTSSVSDTFLAQQRFLQQQAEAFAIHSRERTSINIVGIACSSTSKDDATPRIPSSHRVLQDTLDTAKQMDSSVQTHLHVLEDLNFQHCEGNYSIQGDYCTRPCRISQKMAQAGKADPLTQLYVDLVDRADIVLIATPIRRGAASSLYHKLVERLNCIENQKEVYGVDLVYRKLMGIIIIGAQDGAQAVMGQMMATRSQLGYAFAKSPYIAYTAGGLNNTHTELVGQQITQDQPIIQEMRREMLSNQIEVVKNRRKS